jgi:hypothetical protein
MRHKKNQISFMLAIGEHYLPNRVGSDVRGSSRAWLTGLFRDGATSS